MTHSQVCKKYVTREINRRHNGVEWRAGNVSCQGNVIKSYHWWPMAYYLGEKENQKYFLFNADRYSHSTSRHQGELLSEMKGGEITLSFSALEAMGINPQDIKFDNIIDFRHPQSTEVFYVKGENTLYLGYHNEFREFYEYGAFKKEKCYKEAQKFDRPNQGMFVKYRWAEKKEIDGKTVVFGQWHILGAVVLIVDENYYLCSLDEGTYFISKLPKKATSVEHAFNILKPQPVRVAENNGAEVKRQGEWFFIPTGMGDGELAEKFQITKTALRKSSCQKSLPSSDSSSNDHICIVFNGKGYAQLVEKRNKLNKTIDQLRAKYNDHYVSALKERCPDKSDGEFPQEIVNELRSKYQDQYWKERNKIKDDLEPINKKLSAKNGNKFYCKGTVYHRNGRGTRSGEHQTLKLGQEWHLAYKNTEIESRSMGGRFD
jgi:hypothetical protein